MTKREIIEEMKNKCFNALLSEYQNSNSNYINLDEFAQILGLNRNLSKDEIRLRNIIQLTRDEFKKINFIIANKRNVGYRIAIGVDSLDEKEKQCQRAYKMICAAKSKVFSKTFIKEDLESCDGNRIMQYEALEEFRRTLFSAVKNLRDALVKSPFRGKNLKELEDSIDVQIGKDEI